MAGASTLEIALSQPDAQVAVMGPRPATARLLGKLIIRTCSAGLTVLGAMSMAGALLGGAHSLGVDGGLGEEIGTRMVPVPDIVQAPQKAHWANLPTSPFLEVAHQTDGTYSLDHLIGAYKAAGLTATQAKDALEHLNDLAPVLMGVDDPALEQRLQVKAQEAAFYLNQAYPQAHARLQEMQSSGRVPVAVQSKNWEAPENWMQARRAWRTNKPYLDHDVVTQFQPVQSIPQARLALEGAIKRSGLRALRVTPGTWQNSETIAQLAQGIEQVNSELEKATGWKGQVLGLGGRVILTVADSDVDEAEAYARHTPKGDIEVRSQWANLGHEWFHALDDVVAHQALGASNGRPLSAQLHALRITKNSHVYDSMKGAYQDLDKATLAWKALRTAYSEELQKQNNLEDQTTGGISKHQINVQSYFQAPSEIMAYAFQAHASKPGQYLDAHHLQEEDYMLPSRKETQALAPMWKALFSSLEPLKLYEGLQAPSAKVSLAQRLEARRVAFSVEHSPRVQPGL